MALAGPRGLLSPTGQLALQGLTAWPTITGLDPLQQLQLREGLRWGHLAQKVEMIGHQCIGQHPHPAEGLQPSHQPHKVLSLYRAPSGGLENEAALDHPGNAVVESRALLSLDSGQTHSLLGLTVHNILVKCSENFTPRDFRTCPFFVRSFSFL